MNRTRTIRGALAAFLLPVLVATTALLPLRADATTTSPPVAPSLPLSQKGVWMTDAQGRVVILHGLNQVMKVAPYEPAQDGFGADDAAFLANNGFNAMRLGVVWAAVEPRPGVYNDAYLRSIQGTVSVLASRGIVSLLDFHQDLYNEKFGGEGAPAWATQDGGLPNPYLGFPATYFGSLAENHAWDAFWGNAKASDGVGLQEHYANAWRHVAAFFRATPSVAGYEVLNEPWPGTLYAQCMVPLIGCPVFDQQLSSMYRKVITAIRAVDPKRTIWVEPNVLFNSGIPTAIGPFTDSHTGFAFHDYCLVEAQLKSNLGCQAEDSVTIANARSYTRSRGVPPLMTEFGAVDDLANLAEVIQQADAAKMGWLEWAYTGNDFTSTEPNAQAVVIDPARPPVGANVNWTKLSVLAEPYPQAVAGTPLSYAYSGGVFTLRYSPTRVSGGAFPAGSRTTVALPPIHYPRGYIVNVRGGRVVSASGARTLIIASTTSTAAVTVVVKPRP